MMRASALVLAIATSALAQAPIARFRPSQLFGDHMVLPASSQVPCWGVGEPGAEVTVTASWGKSAKATVGADGHWRCELTTAPGGKAYEVTLASGGDQVHCADVLLGDVWLGSGQSNMEMPVAGDNGWNGVRDWRQEIAAGDHEQLRMFTVQKAIGTTPADDVVGSWQVCSPATVGAMSAAGYFFGRELLAHGHRPLGIVISCWGGTVAEAWTSPDGLAAFPEFAAALAKQRDEGNPALRDERVAAFWGAVEKMTLEKAVDVTVPDLWSRGDLAQFDGVATYTRTITLPAAFVGQDLWLDLGAIDDMDTAWWNGTRIGGHEDDGAWSTPRHYRVPAAANGNAEATVRVRVVDTGGEGGFNGAAEGVCVQLASDEKQVLPLAGTWQRARGAAMADLPPWPRQGDQPNRPAVLWRGMIAPLLPFPFTGVIWYQGESNRDRPEQYSRLFPALVKDWRRAFGRELPFYCVQIAPYDYGEGTDADTAALRDAQGAILSLPRTGMVVTLDCGDAHDIHPGDKQTVGKRLAWLALARHYGEAVPCDGPDCDRVAIDGGALRLHFVHAEGGLQLANDGAGFEVAGSDGHFVAARARLDGDQVIVGADAVAAPKQVRYAWASVPGWSLCNHAGLPAAPFHRAIP